MKKIISITLLINFLMYNNIDDSKIFSKLFSQAIKAIDLEAIEDNYSDSVCVSNFDFLTFKKGEEISDLDSRTVYKLYFNSKSKLKKISKRSKFKEYQNFDIYLFYTSHQYIIGIIDFQKTGMERIFVDGFFLFDSQNHSAMFIRMTKLFSSIDMIDDMGNTKTVCYLNSCVSTDNIYAVFKVNENLNSLTRLNFSQNYLVSYSEIVNNNDEVLEEIYVYDTRKISFGLRDIKIDDFERILQIGVNTDVLIVATVKPDCVQGEPLWLFPSIKYK